MSNDQEPEYGEQYPVNGVYGEQYPQYAEQQYPQYAEQQPVWMGQPPTYPDQQPVYAAARPRHRRRHLALGAAGVLAVVVTVGGAARAEDSPVASFLSTNGSASYLKTNSSTVASSVTGAVVDVVSTETYQGATSAGTGMVLTSNGEILTNNHVVDGATSIKVTVVSTGRTYKANVVGTDPTQDVAVIQLVGASGLKTLPIGSSSSVKVGQKVVARGNAGGVGGAPSVVSGTVTALSQSITASDEGASNAEQLTGLIETNAEIVAGDSGGPLATSSGKVIGMDTAASATNGTTQAASSGDNQGYAIPIKTALTIAHEIATGKASSTVEIGLHGFLGIELQQDSSTGTATGNGNGGGFGGQFGGGRQSRGYFGGNGGGTSSSSSATGAVVSGVIASGAAASTSLSAGDVITSANGSKVDSVTALNKIMAKTKPGQKITLGWTDTSGQSQTAPVTLGTAAAD